MTHNPRRSFAARAVASARARHRRSHETSASSGLFVWVVFGVGILVLVVFWATRQGRPGSSESRYSSGSSEVDSSEGLDLLTRMNASVGEAEVPKAKPKKERPVAYVAPVDSSVGSSVDSSVDSSGRAFVAKAADRASARGAVEPPEDVSERQAAQRVETRVVTLRLSGNVGSAPLDPKDPFTWGRLGYFFQQEMSPRSFLMFPGGGIPTIVKGPTMFKGRVVKKGQDLRDLRPPPGPRGIFGSPRYRIDLLSAVGASGGITFYGQKLGQNYRCQLNVQIFDLEGEQPSLVDAFTITETVTRLARGATGPPDRQTYQMAIEKLVKRLRSSQYFR